MPSNFTLLEFDNIVEQFPGRGVVFGAPYWDGATPLALNHLGETEGVIRMTPNETFAHVRMDEQRGGAKLRTWVKGQEPSIQIPTFLVDQDARAFFSPRGTGSAGFKRWRPVQYKTLMIAPEDLMWDEDTGTYVNMTFSTADGFQINGEAPSARQDALIDQIVFVWKAYFESAPITYGVEQDGRALETVTGHVAPDLSKPDGHELYTFGRDLALSGIDLDPTPAPE